MTVRLGHLEDDVDEKCNNTEPDAGNNGVLAKIDPDHLLDLPGLGPRGIFKQQRQLCHAILKTQIGDSEANRQALTDKVIALADRWLSSNVPKLEERGARLTLRIEEHRLATMRAITDTINAERRAVVDLARVAAAAGESQDESPEYQTVDDVPKGKAVLEGEKAEAG